MDSYELRPAQGVREAERMGIEAILCLIKAFVGVPRCFVSSKGLLLAVFCRSQEARKRSKAVTERRQNQGDSNLLRHKGGPFLLLKNF